MLPGVVNCNVANFVDCTEGVGLAAVPLIMTRSSAHLTTLEVVALQLVVAIAVVPFTFVGARGQSFKPWVLKVIDCLDEGFGGDVGMFRGSVIRDMGFNSSMSIGGGQLLDAEELILQRSVHLVAGQGKLCGMFLDLPSSVAKGLDLS
jgi:hypothetical protein